MGLHVIDFMIDIFGECEKFQVLKAIHKNSIMSKKLL